MGQSDLRRWGPGSQALLLLPGGEVQPWLCLWVRSQVCRAVNMLSARRPQESCCAPSSWTAWFPKSSQRLLWVPSVTGPNLSQPCCRECTEITCAFALALQSSTSGCPSLPRRRQQIPAWGEQRGGRFSWEAGPPHCRDTGVPKGVQGPRRVLTYTLHGQRWRRPGES